MSQVMIKEDIPREDHMTSGHLACPGCAAPIAMLLLGILAAFGARSALERVDGERARSGTSRSHRPGEALAVLLVAVVLLVVRRLRARSRASG